MPVWMKGRMARGSRSISSALKKSIATEARYELARRYYADYVQLVHAGRWKRARHLDLVCEKLESIMEGKTKRLMIFMPPRHGKSMTVTETFPSFFLGKYPEKRVIEISYSGELAQQFGKKNRDKVEEYGPLLFGHSTSNVQATKTNWNIDNGTGGMISVGIGGSITGYGADLLVVDDPIKNRGEAESLTYRDKLWDEYQLSVSQAEALCVEFDSLPALRAQVADLRNQIRALGNVNVSAIEEYQEVRERYDALSAQVADVEGSRNELTRMIASLSGQMKEIFTDSFRAINENFGRIFAELFGGGEASLVLEDESDVLSCGIGIQVAPPGKVIKNLEALSGGEQALVAISIYFAILAVNPAPFCILDEIEAALDDANVSRFAQYLRRVSDKTQFIVITHRRGTMEAANVLYGVTMQEDGVSKLLKLDLEQVDATLVS